MDTVQVHRLIVASPSDVQSERDAVSSVVEELNKTICADRGLHIEVIRWETDSYPGFHPEGPQGLIDRILKIEDCDVLVGIFWKRFGSPTKTAASGTAHELALAYKAWKKKGRPQIMMYFNMKPYMPRSEAETDQLGQVLRFKRDFPKQGLSWPYRGTSNFRELFRNHLARYIRDKFALGPKETGAPPPNVREFPVAPPHYFSVQTELINEHKRGYVGRVPEGQSLDRFLASSGRGYFIIRGGPGQGKTAFLCQLADRPRYVHHFIGRTGGRTDSRLILRSLISQLSKFTATKGSIPESLPDLSKLFEEMLIDSTSDGETIVVLIDALDEFQDEPSGTLDYLFPEVLPRGVHFVISSRPGELEERLRERLYSVPVQVIDLGPLPASDVGEILKSSHHELSATELQRVTDISQGNPLYIRALITQLSANPSYDLQVLPPDVEGFFRSATTGTNPDDPALHAVLGLLAVSRSPLSLFQISEISGISQRQVAKSGIGPIRDFLREKDGAYSFYHGRFHEFVASTVLFQDEIRLFHRQMADWLQGKRDADREYRLTSLAFHLFESGDGEALINAIDEPFLKEKVQRFGYAVLEDLELWTRVLLSREDPALVGRCVSLVEALMETGGEEILWDAAALVQPGGLSLRASRHKRIEPKTPLVNGLDLFVGMLPKAQVAADFLEIVPKGSRLAVEIGDAPSIGLKSAFVARFVANLGRTLLLRSHSPGMGEILDRINTAVSGYREFERISMQCAEFDTNDRVMRVASAGHPYPVHYSARRRICNVLPLSGELLADPFKESDDSEKYEEYELRLGSGDVLVFVTDGLTEDHVLKGDPYGYRFTSIVESCSSMGSRSIGQAILDGWQLHKREEDVGDDVTIAVIKVL
jgi:serine phosphatase RsbU (regulator of sigma subunit)